MTPDYAYLRWITAPSARYGLHFALKRDQWEFWSQERLAELAVRTARALAGQGVGRGDAVAVVLRSGPAFVASLYGTMLAGAACSLIAPPYAMQPADGYRAHVRRVLDIVRPAVIIAEDESLARLRPVAAELSLRSPLGFAELSALTGVTGRTDDVAGPASGRDAVLLQFTSGSSAPGRGVRVSAAALDANVRAIIGWMRWKPGDPAVGWLPAHHDMGLVGCVITSFAAGCEGWLMQPDDFIRTPVRFLRCLSDVRARFTALPGFGLAHLINRVNPRQLAGLDFGSLDAVVVGAERINPRLLDSFHEFLAPFGFRREALLPAYGLAEATLCVTGVHIGQGWTSTRMTSSPKVGQDIEVTGCGRPVDGVQVRVVDANGLPVPDGTPGEIVVSGTSLADGYVASGLALAPSIAFGPGELRTGDAGFLSGGQLFVLGRLGDGIKIRGKMIYAENIEVALQGRAIPSRRAAALLGMRGDVPVAAIVLENAQESWRTAAAEVLRAEVSGAELLTINVPRGAIAVTSSGKPRRRAMWQALTDGRLSGDVTLIQAHRSELVREENAS